MNGRNLRIAVLAAGVHLGAAMPRADDGLPAECRAAARDSTDWTGRYHADEAVASPFPDYAGQIMTYTADVFRDGDGHWRAFVLISGQTTHRTLAACGVAADKSLELRAVRARGDNLSGFEAGEPLVTLQRTAAGKLRMRFPDGSYLENKPFLSAARTAIPPWAGHHVFESCGKDGSAADCWRYRLDVELTDEGWKAAVAIDGPKTTERFLAQGDDYRDAKAGSVLGLEFLAPLAGDAFRGPDRKNASALARLIRRRGTIVLEIGKLSGPPGLREIVMRAER
jgi:hypothetical protein